MGHRVQLAWPAVLPVGPCLGDAPEVLPAGRHNFRKLLSGNFPFEGQFTFHLMGKTLIPKGLRS